MSKNRIAAYTLALVLLVVGGLFLQWTGLPNLGSTPQSPTPIAVAAPHPQPVSNHNVQQTPPSVVNWPAWQFGATIFGFLLVFVQIAVVNKTVATMRGADRAWMLGNNAIEVSTYSQGDTEIKFEWQNFGKSPAFITSYGLRFFMVKATTGAGSAWDIKRAKTQADEVCIPGEAITKKVELDGVYFANSSVAALKEGTAMLILRASITYRDVFGKDHETLVCMKNVPDVGRSSFKPYGGPKYNKQT